MHKGGSDGFLGPRDPVALAGEGCGLDAEAAVAVVTGDMPLGDGREQALATIRPVLLVNDVSPRGLIARKLAKGFGFFQSKTAPAYSLVAVSPDALDETWRDARLHGTLSRAERPSARPDAADFDMTFDFGAPIAHAPLTRTLSAGTIVGSGAVSNRGPDTGLDRPIAAGGGYSCIAEQRTAETSNAGALVTPFLKRGDRVRIWTADSDARPCFGAIDQVVEGAS
jgi:fumarylacetoacetate (FAA) hydrolase